MISAVGSNGGIMMTERNLAALAAAVIIFASASCLAEDKPAQSQDGGLPGMAAPSQNKPEASSPEKPAAQEKPAQSQDGGLPGMAAPSQNKPEASSPEKPAAQENPAPAQEKAKEERSCQESEPNLSGCASKFALLTEGYKLALEGFRKWTVGASAEIDAFSKKEADIKAEIQENEAAITKLKLNPSDKQGKTRMKQLAKDNKQLWGELEKTAKESAALCRELLRQARQRVRDDQVRQLERLRRIEAEIKP
jgi:hypothetical protein